MVGSKLPMPVLGQIWDLSDVDRDGFLDRYEFTVAMHLVFRALQGDKLPDTLPEELSTEKVPKSLSAMPNLNGAPKVSGYKNVFLKIYDHEPLFGQTTHSASSGL